MPNRLAPLRAAWPSTRAIHFMASHEWSSRPARRSTGEVATSQPHAVSGRTRCLLTPAINCLLTGLAQTQHARPEAFTRREKDFGINQAVPQPPARARDLSAQALRESRGSPRSNRPRLQALGAAGVPDAG